MGGAIASEARRRIGEGGRVGAADDAPTAGISDFSRAVITTSVLDARFFFKDGTTAAPRTFPSPRLEDANSPLG